MSAVDNAQTWRDLADQLTPEQIAKMERHERTWASMPDGSEDARTGLLFGARELIGQNLAAAFYQDIPSPGGAETIGPWEPWDDDDDVWARVWEGRSSRVNIAAGNEIEVWVGGIQRGDGRCTRQVSLGAGRGDEQLTAGEARQLADALTEAADELDALNAGADL